METRIIEINPAKVKELQSFLDSKGEDKIATIETFTADFGNSVEVDIKVCQGNPPFVDVVLFINGCDSGCLEPTDELLGEYCFENRTVILKEKG